jgi:hypothetical protein
LSKEKGSFDVGRGERVAKHCGQPFTVECRQHYGRAAFKPVSLNVTHGHFLYNDHSIDDRTADLLSSANIRSHREADYLLERFEIEFVALSKST